MNPGQQVSLDYYQWLNVPEFSVKEVIKASYRNLALKNHPDRGGSTKLMQRINEAYDILIKHKEAYDALLIRIRQPKIEIIFEYAFSNVGGGWTNATTSGFTNNGY